MTTGQSTRNPFFQNRVPAHPAAFYCGHLFPVQNHLHGLFVFRLFLIFHGMNSFLVFILHWYTDFYDDYDLLRFYFFIGHKNQCAFLKSSNQIADGVRTINTQPNFDNSGPNICHRLLLRTSVSCSESSSRTFRFSFAFDLSWYEFSPCFDFFGTLICFDFLR